jgi:transposase InsO family protein
MEVSVSGFHGYLNRQERPDPDAQIRREIREIHLASRGTYGRPRMVKALNHRAYEVGHKRVARLMREEMLRGKIKARFRHAPGERYVQPIFDNVLDRRFAVASKTPAWVGDITYIPTRQGWLYLAVVLSIQTRQVLGYSLSERMPEGLVQQAFMNAWTKAPVDQGVIFHSDRGRQYTGSGFRNLVQEKGFVQSMSRKGNCWDNAVAESFFATLKKEEATKMYPSKAHAHAAIAGYIHGFYNSTRLHSSLGYSSPNDYAKGLKQTA